MNKNAIEVTQYVLPDGRKHILYANLGDEYKKKSEGMVFSAEILTTGVLVVYGRYEDEPEEDEDLEITTNEGLTPNYALMNVIDRVYARRKYRKIKEAEDKKIRQAKGRIKKSKKEVMPSDEI